ncbi:MAG TPA: methyl-accepting chemotaxis protein [Polyangiales bacterium]|jgi:methyl-accepting chemotaxis protein
MAKKIGLGFALTLLCFASIEWIVYRSFERLLDDNRWVVHTHAVLETLENALLSMRRAEASVYGFVVRHDEAARERFAPSRADFDAATDELSRLTLDEPDKPRILEMVRNDARAVFDGLDEALRRYDRDGSDGAVALLRAGDRTTFEALRAALLEVQAKQQKQLAERSRTSDETARELLFAVVGGGTLTLVLCVLVAILITRSVTGRVRELVESATQIGAGNLTHRIDVGSEDELGVLAREFNRMTETLGTTTVSADTERRARARIELLLSTIAQAGNELASSTSEILASTTQQAAGAQEQAAAVAETVTTVNEVVQTSEQAAERARQVADASHRSLDHSRAGRKVIEDSIVAMGTVKDQVESAAESILQLAEQAQAIGEIISTVNEIAEQTNLLALNAAIESSRAGEHGKGFSVVATEVKALAEQSKKATEQVRRILSDIQKSTSSAVMSTEECSKSVNSAARVIALAGDNIRSLADVIDQTAQAATQIAASAGQQAAGTAQIHQAMKNINQVTTQNLSSTQQMERAAKDLNQLGGLLKERLGSFERSAAA